jgi:ankyrin repeat protein
MPPTSSVQDLDSTDSLPTPADQQLLLAAWKGDVAQLNEAIQKKASLQSAFHFNGGPEPPTAAAAARHGQLDELQQLMAADNKLAAQDYDGSTALHLAAYKGHMEVAAELLCSSGGRWDIPDKQGQLPLHVASSHNHLGVVELLLHASRTPAHVDAVTSCGATPLALACSKGHGEVVRLLLAAGADPRHILDSNGEDSALLHLVAGAGHLPVLQQLLAAMVAGQGMGSVNAVGPDGLTAVQVALRGGRLACAQALIAAGADVDRVPGVETMYGVTTHFECTLLHWAVSQGLAAAVPLLANPSNLRLCWHRGHTPMALAMVNKDVAVAQALLAAVPPAERHHTWLYDAWTYAVDNKVPAIRALVPGMLRDECELYKQLLQQRQGVGKQEGRGQRNPAAVLAAVASGLWGALSPTAVDAEGLPAVADQGVACFRVVLEVLGLPSAGGCLQQVLQTVESIDQSVGRGEATRQLLWVLHSGWLEGLQPLLQVRQQAVNPLQEMLGTLPPGRQRQQQQQQQQHADGSEGGTSSSAAAGAQNVQSSSCAGVHGSTQGSVPGPSPEKQALAAARAGQWEEFVQHLEQLTGLQPARACEVLAAVVAAKGRGWSPALARLCEVLLGAWWAGRQTAAARAAQEQVRAVVGAVLACNLRV